MKYSSLIIIAKKRPKQINTNKSFSLAINKSIPEIIAEFIRGAIIFEKKYSFNSTELKDLLNKIYGFDIPESVIRTTLQNKFKDEIKRENNYFHFD